MFLRPHADEIMQIFPPFANFFQPRNAESRGLVRRCPKSSRPVAAVSFALIRFAEYLPTVAAQHTNRLAREKSPYLLQHAHNPVDWFAWRDEAFEKARRENKPIFLSIGYSTCHWCHVMERESFEDENVAAFLNRHFVSIKVDREERPDVDKIYMTFVQATTGSGGWPLNVFLTPDLKPFFGGTYFPPDNCFGRPGLRQLLSANRRALAGAPRRNRRLRRRNPRPPPGRHCEPGRVERAADRRRPAPRVPVVQGDA